MSAVGLASSQFAAAFATRAAVVASAPGRVNLIGEHTDYNGGPVLPVALERRTAVAAAPADRWRFVSTVDKTVREVDPDGPIAGDWTDYVVGVVRGLRALGAAPGGALVAVATTVPIGAGLASSAALTVAAARALAMLAARALPAADLIDVAFRAEHDHAGVHCGRMDQTVAALAERGSALLYETGSGVVRRIPFPGRLWLVETGVSHRLAVGALNERRRDCEAALVLCREWWPRLADLASLSAADLPDAERRLPPPLVPLVRHVVAETARTRAAATALAAGDLAAVGALLNEGHASLRQNWRSTIPEADFVVERAVALGAHGARLTGAGWGGAVVVLAPGERESRIMAELSRDFADRFDRMPDVWRSGAGEGARREAVPARAG